MLCGQRASGHDDQPVHRARLDSEYRVFAGTDGVRLHPWFVYVVCLGEHPARAHVGKRFGVRVGGDLRDTDYDRHLYVYSHGYRRCSSRLWIAIVYRHDQPGAFDHHRHLERRHGRRRLFPANDGFRRHRGPHVDRERPAGQFDDQLLERAHQRHAANGLVVQRHKGPKYFR